MSIVCCGLLALALYRFYTLSGKKAIFESRYSIFILFIISAIYSIPAILVQRLATVGQTKEKVLEMLEIKAPHYISVVEQVSCSAFKTPLLGAAFVIFYGIQISIVEFIGLLYTMKTVKLLKQVRSSLSAATYSAQKQFIRSIFIQFMIPLFVLVVPVVVFFFIQWGKLQNTNGKLSKF